ncbi:GlsB/YeaQ/YmgE family stress response membrane protein [Streptosporangium sp. NBC_01639]|uniref:GlsB/YeaQ/YmgE family stress response membrane protein n=1 Tax=unclassified Streptosporangium TaxID=2632669 RepID=UPI002DDB91DF|nr:GlsB/YeaQ/YmgE family stress response membrane protein [Streptosporangium sp. NBC_01756]WSC83364.1 GlsB/YeaQ/YmgE family stress response membrane protein [Streptosporangium sp. NBC_01756]WTD58063.1 GlsB/YeaQ/YmgE family stress response membrane protein [Streptosporangium sp. NBC_01639]
MIGSIVSAIVIGAIVGALARLLIPGRQKLSIGLTLIVGIVAALVGTLIAGLLGFADTRGIDWWEHVLQLVLAVAAVLVVVQMRANKAR